MYYSAVTIHLYRLYENYLHVKIFFSYKYISVRKLWIKPSTLLHAIIGSKQIINVAT